MSKALDIITAGRALGMGHDYDTLKQLVELGEKVENTSAVGSVIRKHRRNLAAAINPDSK